MEPQELPGSIFQSVLDRIAMVAVTDLSGTFRYVNDNFCANTGYSREQLLGANPRLLNSGLHSKAFFEDMWKTILAGKTWKGEICNRKPTGELYWQETTIFPVSGPQGQTEWLVSVRHEIGDNDRLMVLYQNVIGTRSHGIIATDLQGRITLFNKGAERLLGYSSEEVVGSTNTERFHDPYELSLYAETMTRQLGRPVAPGFSALVAKVGDKRCTDENDWTMIAKDGKKLTVKLSISPLIDPRNDDLQGFLAIAYDLTASRKIAAQVPGLVYQLMLRPDGSSCFPYASEGIVGTLRMRPQDVRLDADRFFNLVHSEDLPRVGQALRESARAQQQLHLEFRVHFGQETRWILTNALPETQSDGSTLWHGFMTDITAQKVVEEQVRWSAFHDPLTSLHNRLYAHNEILRMEFSRRYPIAVFNIDLDGLKQVNDRYGHDAGDLYIQTAAEVFKSTFRSEDLVARMGGDEFVALLPETGEEGMQSIRQRLYEQLQRVNRDATIPVQFSVGCVVAHVIGDLESSLREADKRMYEDKTNRKAHRI